LESIATIHLQNTVIVIDRIHQFCLPRLVYLPELLLPKIKNTHHCENNQSAKQDSSDSFSKAALYPLETSMASANNGIRGTPSNVMAAWWKMS
jgi:hypothetical protein